MTKFFKMSIDAYWSLRPEMEAEDFCSVNRMFNGRIITYVKRYGSNFLCKVVGGNQYDEDFLPQGR